MLKPGDLVRFDLNVPSWLNEGFKTEELIHGQYGLVLREHKADIYDDVSHGSGIGSDTLYSDEVYLILLENGEVEFWNRDALIVVQMTKR